MPEPMRVNGENGRLPELRAPSPPGAVVGIGTATCRKIHQVGGPGKRGGPTGGQAGGEMVSFRHDSYTYARTGRRTGTERRLTVGRREPADPARVRARSPRGLTARPASVRGHHRADASRHLAGSGGFRGGERLG